jgi:cell division septation protein DedD
VVVDHEQFDIAAITRIEPADSGRAAARARAVRDSVARADSMRALLPARGIFTVSFAVLRSDSSARDMARRIRVRGQAARVVQAMIDATPIFRVVLGPYASREEAESVGRASGRSYWVYEGPP